MPNGEFEKQLAEWERLSGEYETELKAIDVKLHGPIVGTDPWTGIPIRGDVEMPEPPPYFERKPGVMYPVGIAAFPKPVATPEYEAKYIEATVMEYEAALTNLGRANWFRAFYSMAPLLVQSGKIATLEEYVKVTGADLGMITSDDLVQVKSAIESMKAGGVTKPTYVGEETPDFLKISPEEEEAVREFLTAEVPKGVPVSMHTLTVQEIMKALATAPRVSPPEMEMGRFLEVCSVLDIPEDVLKELVDIDELVRPYSEAYIAQEQMIKDVLSGVAEWEMPEVTAWEKFKFAAIQPMQAMADLIEPYLHSVSYPLAGLAVYNIQRVIPGEQELELEFESLREEGVYLTKAAREAWWAWEAPWGAKLAIEIAVDPITYTPGILLRIPGNILVKVGLRTAGLRVLRFNRSLWKALDYLPNLAKARLAKMPKAIPQIEKAAADNFNSTMVAAVTKHTGRPLNLITADDILDASRASIKVASKAGAKSDDFLFDYGKQLLEFAPMEPNEIISWSRSLGAKLQLPKKGIVAIDPYDLTDTMIDNVNDILSDTVAHYGNLEANAKRVAILLGLDDSPAFLARIGDDLTSYISKYTNRLDKVARVARESNINPVADTFAALRSQQDDIIRSMTRSRYWRTKEFGGIVAGLQNKVEALSKAQWRTSIDRYLVRPMAEAYLGNPAYPLWNALESIVVSGLEGVVPRQINQKVFQMAFQGVKGVDTRVLEWAASDVIGMIGGLPGRAGAVSFLPGKQWIPEAVAKKLPKAITNSDWIEWSGRKYLEFSDKWGTAYRANFLVRKQGHYFSELLLDVNGIDVNDILIRAVGKPPSISRSSLRLTGKELKNDMLSRVYTGERRNVAAMKDIYTEANLSKGEQLKIIRQADELSPQAKTMAEQLVETNQFLRSEDDIIKSCRLVADQAVSDITPVSTQLTDNFHTLANSILATEVKTPDELMQLFKHYEVMVETAGSTPSVLLSKTFSQADALKRLGKYGAIERLWRTDRQGMLDALRSIDGDLGRIRGKILANKHLLNPEQQRALETLYDTFASRDALRESFLRADGELLDKFWALSKAERTAEAHTSFRVARGALFNEYRQSSAVLGAEGFLAKKSYAELYYKLPAERLIPVNATARALSAQDIARVLGCNVDNLTSSLTQNVAMQDKRYFAQLIKQSADARPRIFKGFTEEKIAVAYDDILRGMRMSPDVDVAAQKVLQQVEGIKQQMINLRMTKALPPSEQTALHGWIDDVARRMDEAMYVKGKLKPEFQNFQELRQQASDAAHIDYYKTFADYTHQNIIDYTMKMIFPYWTYHLYRWLYMPMQLLRKPGAIAAWGKYTNYTEYGYFPIPGTDLQMNPAIGSMWGITFGLARYDFVSYYENLGWMGEALDLMQRRGFYPGVHMMLPVVLSPLFSGRPPELGDVLPPVGRTAIELMIASDAPGVSAAAQQLRDMVLHENFRDYYTTTIIDNYQVKSGGKLIEGQTGADLWHKRMRNEPLTEEEQELWDRASKETALYTALRSNFPFFRLRPEEYVKAYSLVTQVFESYLGMSPEFQENLWRHNKRPTDVVGGLPLDVRAALDELWQWKIWFGRGQVLMPPEISDLYGMIGKFWSKAREYQDARVATQLDTDSGFISPTPELHFNGREWREERIANWQVYQNSVEAMETSDEYRDAMEAMTPEGQVALAKRTGFSTPVRGPIDEVIDIYFSIELEKTVDEYSGEEEWDYLKFWLKRETVRMALTDEQRVEFDAYILKRNTPLEMVFRDVYKKYIRGYQAVSRILIEGYSEEQKAIIAEFYADGTSASRKEEIRDIINPDTGNKLISGWETNRATARARMRDAFPELDFWLYVFGYVSKPRTPEARAMVDEWELHRESILTIII